MTKTSTLPCECALAGYCERHKMEKSKAKHRLCQRDKSYRQMWDNLVAGVSPPKTGIVTKAVRLSDARSVWKEAGSPIRSKKEVARIFDTCCKPCQHYEGNDTDGRCTLCSCQLHRIGGLINKIEMATEECPINKW